MTDVESREGDTSSSSVSGEGSTDKRDSNGSETKEIQNEQRKPRTASKRPHRRDVPRDLAKNSWGIRENRPDDLSETEQFILKNIQPKDLAAIKNFLIDGSEGQIGLQNAQGTLIAMIERRFFNAWNDAKIRGWLTMKMYRPETVDRYIQNLKEIVPFVAALIEERMKKEAVYHD